MHHIQVSCGWNLGFCVYEASCLPGPRQEFCGILLHLDLPGCLCNLNGLPGSREEACGGGRHTLCHLVCLNHSPSSADSATHEPLPQLYPPFPAVFPRNQSTEQGPRFKVKVSLQVG